MTAYSIFHGMVGREITGVSIDGKSYSIDELRAALSASPSPVASRDGLIERLEDAVRIYLEALDSDPEKDVLDEDGVSFASDWSHQRHDAEVAAALDDVRAALAAKEQQP